MRNAMELTVEKMWKGRLKAIFQSSLDISGTIP